MAIYWVEEDEKRESVGMEGRSRVTVQIVYEGPTEWLDRTLLRGLFGTSDLTETVRRRFPNGATIERTFVSRIDAPTPGTDDGR